MRWLSPICVHCATISCYAFPRSTLLQCNCAGRCCSCVFACLQDIFVVHPSVCQSLHMVRALGTHCAEIALTCVMELGFCEWSMLCDCILWNT